MLVQSSGRHMVNGVRFNLFPTDLAALRRHWRGRIEQVYQMRSIDFLCDGVLLALVGGQVHDAPVTRRNGVSPIADYACGVGEEALRCQLAIYRSLDSIVSGWGLCMQSSQ
jgi:hypothetical protein